LHKQTVSWTNADGRAQHQVAAGKTYVRPSGYKVRMEKPPGGNAPGGSSARWPKATLCHKPCTVSGGGKSEISKPITDAILTGPVFVADLKK
jgi:phosphoenolpyruvate carboxykinase (diphosphate)